jgi:hypothetical protein
VWRCAQPSASPRHLPPDAWHGAGSSLCVALQCKLSICRSGDICSSWSLSRNGSPPRQCLWRPVRAWKRRRDICGRLVIAPGIILPVHLAGHPSPRRSRGISYAPGCEQASSSSLRPPFAEGWRMRQSSTGPLRILRGLWQGEPIRALRGQGKDRARTGQRQGKDRARTGQGQGKDRARTWDKPRYQSSMRPLASTLSAPLLLMCASHARDVAWHTKGLGALWPDLSRPLRWPPSLVSPSRLSKVIVQSAGVDPLAGRLSETFFFRSILPAMPTSEVLNLPAGGASELALRYCHHV